MSQYHDGYATGRAAAKAWNEAGAALRGYDFEEAQILECAETDCPPQLSALDSMMWCQGYVAGFYDGANRGPSLPRHERRSTPPGETIAPPTERQTPDFGHPEEVGPVWQIWGRKDVGCGLGCADCDHRYGPVRPIPGAFVRAPDAETAVGLAVADGLCPGWEITQAIETEAEK